MAVPRSLTGISHSGVTFFPPLFIDGFQPFKTISPYISLCLCCCSTCNSLSKFCPKLKHLDLASCTSITNLSLKALRCVGFVCTLNPQHFIMLLVLRMRWERKASLRWDIQSVCCVVSKACHIFTALVVVWRSSLVLLLSFVVHHSDPLILH